MLGDAELPGKKTSFWGPQERSRPVPRLHLDTQQGVARYAPSTEGQAFPHKKEGPKHTEEHLGETEVQQGAVKMPPTKKKSLNMTILREIRDDTLDPQPSQSGEEKKKR